MKQVWTRALALLVAVSVLVILAISIGLVPALDPAPSAAVKLDIGKTVEPSAPLPKPEAPVSAPRLVVTRVPVCKAPRVGARLLRSASGTDEAVLVWCDGGYELFALGSAPSGRQLTRIARFSSQSPRPGGAASGDFDADGALDLMLGVAPEPLVLHQPGAGAYWVRGRREGGYEPARSIVEAPTVALAAADLDGEGATELLVLTRGDLAAQRPGELWLFRHGPTLARAAVFPVGIDPRDLVVLTAGETPRALGLCGDPGTLVMLSLTRDVLTGGAPVRASLPVRGGAGFLIGPRTGDERYLRDPTDLKRVRVAPELQVDGWARHVNVGPGVVVDLDRDGSLETLAVTEHGLAHVGEGENNVPEELAIDDARLLDLTTVRDMQGLESVLALAEHGGELSILFVPGLPWAAGAQVVLEVSSALEQGTVADVPLE